MISAQLARATRRMIPTLIVVALVLVPGPGVAAGDEPLRSGTIVTGDGWFVEHEIGGCQMAPDCLAWLESGCDPALAGRDPGLMSSIENIADLADGRTPRRYEFGPGDPGGLVWGGSVLQLWRQDCTEIRGHRWRSTDCDGDETGRDCSSKRFRIPSDARWMTVTGYPENVNLAWTLT